jgi:acetyltransferase-like isoleucine patch superfamily enzyme
MENKELQIDDTAVVKSGKIGLETKIWQFVVILEGAIIGKNCNICAHCFIENDVKIGDNVTVKCGVSIWDGIEICEDVFIGPNVSFTNDPRPRSKKHLSSYLKTVIKKNASIGANSTIIAGITIGENAMIGAGSVVTKDIPANTLWYGCPAKFESNVCDCGENLDKDLSCKKCGADYIFSESRIKRKN